MNAGYKRLPETDQMMTVEDFAKWLLELPEDYRHKQIWFIDVSMIYKDKPLNVELSPTGTHIFIEDDHS